MRAGRRLRAVLVGFALLCAAAGARAEDESSRRDPYAGYAFPAGGARGTTFQILVGGQNLRGVKAAYVSGQGVTATVVRHVRPLSPQQMQELRRQLADAAEAQRTGRRVLRRADPDEVPVELPDHPLLQGLEAKTPRELRAIATRFLGAGARRQTNGQIAETVEIDVTVAGDAQTGEREMRLGTPAGLTNPLRFHVVAVPEIREDEWSDGGKDAQALDPPLVLDGQILPGDVDRVRIRGKRGQRLVIDVAARRLMPYLADAVPGWFQATATLRDAAGREIAYSDDWRVEPDPVLFVTVPADGEYVLDVHDALFRGREDFVYRVSVGEQPFVTRMFPLGGRTGVPLCAAVGGWNLPGTSIALDTSAAGTSTTAVRRGAWTSNQVAYSVDDLEAVDEEDPDDDGRTARPLTPPVVVDGRVAKPGDVDVFSFEGRAGEEIVVEVLARRLGSPLDSVVTLADAAGRALAWNDDHDDPAAGLVTHQADSYVRATLPADGLYRVTLVDAQRHGGPEYAYRLRIGPPRPSFDAFVVPSSINVPAGGATPFRVRIVRRDGFDGPVNLALAGAPAGFVLSGGRVARGLTATRMTLTAPAAFDGPLVLRIDAVARIAGVDVRRTATPADDRMQAFAYRHLVPAQELMACVVGSARRSPAPIFAADAPVRIPAGGTVEVGVSTGAGAVPMGVTLELDEPPPGIALEAVRARPGGFTLTLRADASVPVGTADNLIVDLVSGAPLDRGARNAPRRPSLGSLPAIAFEVVAR